MKTPLSSENPFLGSVRLEQAYIWERLSQLFRAQGPLRILDYGTHDGAMLHSISTSGILSASVGVDVNISALESLSDTAGSVTLQAVTKGEPLPFPDQSFDAVTLVGVLEHIHRQDLLLTELHRVLKTDGRLLVSVPGQHLFSFLDLGNLKFRYPKLHRRYYTYRHTEDDYIRRYIEGENGLIGDIELEKSWHEHFTKSRLSTLLSEACFIVVDDDGFGYFYRAIHNAYYLSPIFKKSLLKLMLRDMRSFEKAEIFLECQKKPST